MEERQATRVLLVEDNPGDANLVKVFLADAPQGAAFVVEECRSLSEALGHVAANPVDAVLLDLGLPDSQGLDTFRKMGEKAPGVPILVLTGLDDIEIALAAVKEGAADFLSKGQIDGELLSRAIRYAIERTKAERERRRSEQRYRDLFEGSLAGVYLASPDGEILDCNNAFASILGYPSRRDVLGLRAQDLYPDPKERAVFLASLGRTGGVTNREILLRRQDGGSIWAVENARLLTVAEGDVIEGTVIDISERKESENRRQLLVDVLGILNRPNEWRVLIDDILQTIQAATGFEAIAIRLLKDGDYPYAAASGFPEDFLRTESSICHRDAGGDVVVDEAGRPVLDCMCGSVIRGRTDPAFPFFTKGGSFWTPSTSDLLASTSERDRGGTIRSACNAFRYESVGLVPVRSGSETIGLLQLNDSRRAFLDEQSVRFFEGLAGSIGVAYTRQRAEERIRLLLTRQTHVNQLALELGHTTTIAQVYATTYEHVSGLMDADAFLILYRDEEENLLRTDYAIVDGAPSAVRSASFGDEARSAADEVLRTGRPLHVPGSPSDTDMSALLVPIQVAGETTGVIEVHSRRVGGYTDGHIELLAGMANVAAIALRNARLIERIARDAEKLRSTLSGTINALSMASETRDPYTAGHQRRVTELACAIGETLGLPAEKIDGLRMAGLLHDIGKMAVPAEILVKPSKLTETEFELLQAHPTVGFNILKSAEMPRQVAEIVLQHHERLDGSGYPRGIRGDEIMLEARILTVADVVEAMSSHRPYRPALGLETALEEIETQKGEQFDPSVVEACVVLCREGGFTFSQENAA